MLIFVCVCLFLYQCQLSYGIFLIVPEDVPAGFAAIYGFTPFLLKANDHRIGFGFRFGNHADLQLLYEIGPQTYTKPLQPIRIRSASYRERIVRRRPILEFLLRAGLVREAAYNVNFSTNECDEPR